MKRNFVLTLCALLGWAHVAQGTEGAPPAAGAKTVWASGLQDPHGMALDADGTVLIAEYKGGRVARFSADGKKLGAIGEGSKNPAWVATAGKSLYVTERKANRVLRVAGEKPEPLTQPVDEPLGVAVNAKTGQLYVVSHTTSTVWALPSAQSAGALKPFYAPAPDARRYGFRCAAVGADGSVYVTDETDGRILKVSPDGGKAETWVLGLDDPSGIEFGPDGAVYVADEGAGKVLRIGADRKPTVVAEGFEQPRGLLFLKDGSLLVGDRADGKVYRVSVPE